MHPAKGRPRSRSPRAGRAKRSPRPPPGAPRASSTPRVSPRDPGERIVVDREAVRARRSAGVRSIRAVDRALEERLVDANEEIVRLKGEVVQLRRALLEERNKQREGEEAQELSGLLQRAKEAKLEALAYSKIGRAELSHEVHHLFDLLMRARAHVQGQNEQMEQMAAELEAERRRSSELEKQISEDRKVFAKMVKEDREKFGDLLREVQGRPAYADDGSSGAGEGGGELPEGSDADAAPGSALPPVGRSGSSPRTAKARRKGRRRGV